MKYLLVLAVVFIGVWIWRSNRGGRMPPPGRSGTDAPRVIEMVRCDVCGIHCAKLDALPGKRGVYCTAQHRSQAEP